MFLWLDGMKKGSQLTPLQDVIKKADGDISVLLLSDIFMKSIKLGEQDAIDSIASNVKPMLNILFQDLEDYDEILLEHLSEQWNSIIDILELKLEPIQKQLEVHYDIMFEIQNRHFIPDPQWAFAAKVFEIIWNTKPSLITKQLQKHQFMISYFIHLNITSVTQMIVHFFELSFNQQQLDFLNHGIQQFLQLDRCSVINFTFIIHEIMTRIQSDQLVKFIIKGDVLKQMFQIIRQELNTITLKNAAHIISLITNYYSVKLQNIDLDESETEEIIEDFEKTEFFTVLITQLTVIKDLLQKSLQMNTIGILRIKLVEIIDNLIRITNIRLWEEINKQNIIPIILELVLKFNKSDIFIQYVDKMVSFIFDRALSDFHPFWAQQLIVNQKIHHKRIPIIEKAFHWFARELSDKIIEEGELIHYFKDLKQIQSEFQQSSTWKKIQAQYAKTEQLNQIVLGDYLNGSKSDSPVVVSAMKVEDELPNEDSIKDNDEDEEIPVNIFINLNKDKNQNNNDNDDDEIVGTNSEALNKLQCMFKQMDYKDKEQELKMRKRHSASLEQNLEKFPKNLSNSCGDYNVNKKQALTSSLRLKSYNPIFEEFHIDVEKDRKILRKDDNSILKVDELDELKIPSPQKQQQQQLLKVVYKKEENLVETQFVAKPIRSLKFINFDKQQMDEKVAEEFEAAPLSAEALKFRKIKDEDKQFLNFINKIK